jgi:hypothetical protein
MSCVAAADDQAPQGTSSPIGYQRTYCTARDFRRSASRVDSPSSHHSGLKAQAHHSRPGPQSHPTTHPVPCRTRALRKTGWRGLSTIAEMNVGIRASCRKKASDERSNGCRTAASSRAQFRSLSHGASGRWGFHLTYRHERQAMRVEWSGATVPTQGLGLDRHAGCLHSS